MNLQQSITIFIYRYENENIEEICFEFTVFFLNYFNISFLLFIKPHFQLVKKDPKKPDSDITTAIVKHEYKSIKTLFIFIVMRHTFHSINPQNLYLPQKPQIVSMLPRKSRIFIYNVIGICYCAILNWFSQQIIKNLLSDKSLWTNVNKTKRISFTYSYLISTFFCWFLDTK